jgi:hypothetical protein
MKTKLRILFFISACAIVFIISCKKENGSKFQITFTNNLTEGTADSNGEFTLTGHISSRVALDQVDLTKQGDAGAFLIDESTAKNKYEYDYSYLITGITANTTIVMDVYDQFGSKSSALFLIRK